MSLILDFSKKENLAQDIHDYLETAFKNHHCCVCEYCHVLYMPTQMSAVFCTRSGNAEETYGEYTCEHFTPSNERVDNLERFIKSLDS